MPCLPAVSFLLTWQPAADSNESWVLQKATGEADDIWNKISHNCWQNRAYRRITAPEIPTAAASSAKSKPKWSFSNANDLQHYHHTEGYKGGNCSCQFCDLKCPSFCETTSFFVPSVQLEDFSFGTQATCTFEFFPDVTIKPFSHMNFRRFQGNRFGIFATAVWPTCSTQQEIVRFRCIHYTCNRVRELPDRVATRMLSAIESTFSFRITFSYLLHCLWFILIINRPISSWFVKLCLVPGWLSLFV